MIRLFVVAICSTVFIISTSSAEEKRVSLDDAVKEALNRSPFVQELESRLEARKADAFEARTLPNPELDTEFGTPISWEDNRGKNEASVALTQPFKFSHGELRNRLSTLIQESGTEENKKEILELVIKVKLAFARAWVLSEKYQVLQELRPQTLSLEQFVRSGIKEGVYGKGDGAVFRSELSKTEAELKGISAESIVALADLSRLSGISYEGAKFLAPELSETPPENNLQIRLSQGETKLQKRLKILVDLARADAEVAKRDAFPELRPKLSYLRANDGVDILGLGISFELPFYSQNTAERQRKNAELRASKAKFNFSVGDTFKQSILNVCKAYSLRREEIIIYEKEVLPTLQEALKAFEVQVRSGQGSIFQLWQTLREYVDANERYLELWTKAYAEQAELSILLEEEI